MNRLARALSPYLLQHQNNPVDWFPWGDEAFELARQTDRPIFLSVGYAACHWCHVMEHESFESEAIAEFLNKYFVSIKVDREERPDIDQIYMNAVQVMTGRGGWPMSVFLDHERKPFYAGTYWPPVSRGGMPGFSQVIDAIADAWKNRRDEVLQHAGEITEALERLATGGDVSASGELPPPETVDRAIDHLMSVLDRKEGGFGAAPKFPHATDLLLLLQRAAKPGPSSSQWLQAIDLTLDKMACGGIRDHLGGGFARYSVDAQWLVPHFEKMLYDNGLLALVYLRAFQVTGHQRHAEVAAETLDYIVGELVDPAGGFHCSEDADSEGVEGKFYVWTPSEVMEVLGDQQGKAFCDAYDITEPGNFEGRSIPNLESPLAEDLFVEAREKLRLHRDQRIHPGRDDKIVVAWNALAIEALATSAMMLDRADHEAVAVRAADFIFTKMTRADGRLLHAYRAGKAHLDAYADDYAFLANACITLFECTGDIIWIARAKQLSDVLRQHFFDHQNGGFFYTANDAEKLITRNQDWHDGSLVSGNAATARLMWRLYQLTQLDDLREAVRSILAAGHEVLQSQAMAAGALVSVLDQFHNESANEQWVFGVPSKRELREVRQVIASVDRTHVTVSWVIETLDDASEWIPLHVGKQIMDGQITWYRCKNQVCEQPIVGLEEIVKTLSSPK